MNKRQLFSVIWEKSRLNLKSEAGTNYLSYLWWVIEPVLQMLCFYIVFELLLQRGGEGFVYFLLVGLVPWLWFARTVTQGSNSLIFGRNLMAQLSIPKVFFPMVIVTQCTVKQLMIFLLLLLFLLISGFLPGANWLGAIVIMLVQLLFICATTLLLALFVVFVADIKQIIPTFIQFMFFCTGIFYSVERISEEYRSWFMLNPMAGLIKNYRDVLLEGLWPDWTYLGGVTLFSAVLLVVALFLYTKYEFKIAKLVQE